MAKSHFLHVFQRRCELLYPPGNKCGVLIILNTDKSAKEIVIFSLLALMEAVDECLVCAE